MSPANDLSRRKGAPLLANSLADSHMMLDEAERRRQAGELDRAQSICEALLKTHPNYVGALHTLGLVLADQRQFAEAMPYLVRASMHNPRDWKTLTVLSGVFIRLGATEMAARILEQARHINPNDAAILVTLGEIYREEQEYELAATAFRGALQLDDTLQVARLGVGLCCMHLGEFAEAAGAYEELVRQGPQSIGTLMTYNLLPASYIKADILNLVNAAVRTEGQTQEDFDASVAFVRGTALHNMGKHVEAWSNLLTANRLCFSRFASSYEKEKAARLKFLDYVSGSTPKIYSDRAKDTVQTSLFILGPSRSGKTTLERLAAKIEGVKRGYENPIVLKSVNRTFQSAGLLTRDQLIELPSSLHSMFRNFYLEELKERAGSAKVFTSAHPGRIFDVLRIAEVIPNVRIILVKRDIDDLTLRIFMKSYQQQHPYAYDIVSIREYIRWYNKMIDIVKEKFPNISIVIKYEDLIVNPRIALKQIADLVGLHLDEGALPIVGDDRNCAAPYSDFMK